MALALLSNAHDSSLIWLGLGGNEITDRGAEHLAVSLKAQHMTNGHLLLPDGEEGKQSSAAATQNMAFIGLICHTYNTRCVHTP